MTEQQKNIILNDNNISQDEKWLLINAPEPKLDKFDLEAMAEGEAIGRTTILIMEKGKGHCGSSVGGKGFALTAGSGYNKKSAQRLFKVTAADRRELLKQA